LVPKQGILPGMVQHPYVPRTLVLDGYEPNFLSIIEILAGYGIASVLVVVLIWYLSGKSITNSFPFPFSIFFLSVWT
jgi:hypothetical protein